MTKVIDLSADFRLKDVKVYEEWYKIGAQSAAVYRRGGIRSVRNQPGEGQRRPYRCESGLLSDLQHTLHLSARKGAAD